MDKTGSTQSRDTSPPPYVAMNPQLSITPVQCQSKWKAVRTNASNNVPRCWVFASVKKIASYWHLPPCAGNIWG